MYTPYQTDTLMPYNSFLFNSKNEIQGKLSYSSTLDEEREKLLDREI